ncbi:MAG TPA: HypC/HybG/HupF family hydrogenase formation chaperone [Balneolales bacterium]|nr:HypC/HybG/HupF family hydrogenase formation chaperone [Balneolales bacterium]
MCLGIPGKIVEIGHQEDELLMGKVSFGGLKKEVCLSYVPDAKIGDYVIVHVGFALSKLDEQEARQVFDYLEELDSDQLKINNDE